MRVNLKSLLIGAVALSMPLSALAQAEDQEILPEWEEAGVVEGGLYESPQFGYEVAWAGDWSIDESFDVDAVQSDAAVGDLIYLWEPEDAASFSITGSGIETWEFEDPEAPQDEWLQILEDTGDQTEGDLYEVLYADVVDEVAINVTITDEYTNDGSNLMIYRTMQLVDRGDGVGIVIVFVPLDTFEDAYASLDDIELDGTPVGGVLSSGDIDDIVTQAEDLDGGTTTDDGTDDTTDSEDDTTDGEDDGTDDGGTPVSGDYLDTVAEDVANREAELERLYEIANIENPTDDDATEFVEIVDGWEDATAIAAELEPDADLEDLHADYVDYMTALEDANIAFNEFAVAEVGSAEEDEALDAFFENVELADSLSDDVIAGIEDAGADVEGVDPDEATPEPGDDDDGEDFDPGFL